MLKDFKMTARMVDSGDYFRFSKYVVAITHRPSGQTFETEYSQGPGIRRWKVTSLSSAYGNWRPRRGQPANVTRRLKDCPQNRQILDEFAKITEPIPPELHNVLESLASDAMCVWDGETFEDFCHDLGYDADSRTAERVYHACIEIAQWFRRIDINPSDLFSELTDQE